MSNTITPSIALTIGCPTRLIRTDREAAELFKRDIPSAELHLFDTGHFALEEEVDRIESLI